MKRKMRKHNVLVVFTDIRTDYTGHITSVKSSKTHRVYARTKRMALREIACQYAMRGVETHKMKVRRCR